MDPMKCKSESLMNRMRHWAAVDGMSESGKRLLVAAADHIDSLQAKIDQLAPTSLDT